MLTWVFGSPWYNSWQRQLWEKGWFWLRAPEVSTPRACLTALVLPWHSMTQCIMREEYISEHFSPPGRSPGIRRINTLIPVSILLFFRFIYSGFPTYWINTIHIQGGSLSGNWFADTQRWTLLFYASLNPIHLTPRSGITSQLDIKTHVVLFWAAESPVPIP